MATKKKPTIMDQLREPFPPGEMFVKVQTVSKSNPNRGLVVAYIDRTSVQNRLDDVVGIGEWDVDFEDLVVTEKKVVTRATLTVRFPDDKVTRVSDVGVGTGLNAEKGAYSDALKRAGTMLGIGRYLYRLPRTWADLERIKGTNSTLPKDPHKIIANMMKEYGKAKDYQDPDNEQGHEPPEESVQDPEMDWAEIIPVTAEGKRRFVEFYSNKMDEFFLQELEFTLEDTQKMLESFIDGKIAWNKITFKKILLDPELMKQVQMRVHQDYDGVILFPYKPKKEMNK